MSLISDWTMIYPREEYEFGVILWQVVPRLQVVLLGLSRYPFKKYSNESYINQNKSILFKLYHAFSKL